MSKTYIKEGAILPGIDGEYYQWLSGETDMGEGNLRFLHIKDINDSVNISELMFKSVEEAAIAIKENSFGINEEDAANMTLVKVTRRFVNNPFK